MTGMAKQSAIRLATEDWEKVREHQARLKERGGTGVSLNDALVNLLHIGLRESTRRAGK